jgi:hypothetical protein
VGGLVIRKDIHRQHAVADLEEVLHQEEEEAVLPAVVDHQVILLLHHQEQDHAKDQVAVVAEALQAQQEEAALADQVHVVGTAQEDVNPVHPLHLLPVIHHPVAVEKDLPAAADNKLI